MPMTEQIRRDALALPLIDRAASIEDLLASIDRPDQSLDALWAEESKQRYAAYKSGRMEAIDADDVFTELEDL